MLELKSIDSITDFINNNELALIYFASSECDVCGVLLPKVEILLLKYPEIASAKIEVGKIPEVAGKFSVFTIPAILFYIDQTETIRKGRFISIDELDKAISRYYDMVIDR